MAARLGELGHEGDRSTGLALERVDVEEVEVALAQRDQMAVGAEIGLDSDRLAVDG